MSRKAAGKGRAVLEGVGLDSETIGACFSSMNEEEAVQAGLIKWCGGLGNKRPSWRVLFAAMEYAQIAQQHIHDLKKESGLFGKQCMCDRCVCVCVCVFVCVCVCMCVCVCPHNCLLVTLVSAPPAQLQKMTECTVKNGVSQ